jgi:hypothetical protein
METGPRPMARRIAIPLPSGARRLHPDPPVASGSGTPTPSALDRVASRLVARLAVLEGQLDAGDRDVWSEYTDVARTLAAIWPLLAPAQHQLLTTAELAARCGVSEKTIRRRKALGLIKPALEHGRLFRWRADQGVR